MIASKVMVMLKADMENVNLFTRSGFFNKPLPKSARVTATTNLQKEKKNQKLQNRS